MVADGGPHLIADLRQQPLFGSWRENTGNGLPNTIAVSCHILEHLEVLSMWKIDDICGSAQQV